LDIEAEYLAGKRRRRKKPMSTAQHQITEHKHAASQLLGLIHDLKMGKKGKKGKEKTF
jgi:hypothetical protein